MPIELKMQAPRLEKIVDPQKNFELVERLEEKIGRAGAEGAQLRIFIGVGGENNDGEKSFRRGRAQRFQNGEAVDMRHH